MKEPTFFTVPTFSLAGKACAVFALVLFLFLAPFGLSAGATSESIKLNGPLPSPGHVHGFELSPDGTLAAYAVETLYGVGRQIYVAPVDGTSAPIHLTDGFASKYTVFEYRFTPDSDRLIFAMIDDSTTELEWYSSDVTNRADRIRLDGFSVPAGKYSVVDDISPDGSLLVYRLMEEDGAESGNFQSELYSYVVSGGTTVQLKSTPEMGVDVGQASLTPDEQTVIFKTELFNPAGLTVNFYAVPIVGGTEVELAAGLPAGHIEFEYSPDGKYFIHTPYGIDEDLSTGIFSVAVDGSGSQRLDEPEAEAENQISEFEISANSQTVIFYKAGVGVFTAPLAGGVETMIDECGLTAANISFTQDNQSILYVCDYHLYAVPVVGGEPRRISWHSPWFVPHGFNYKQSADGKYVVYWELGNLWRTSIETGETVKLSHTEVSSMFFITSDSKKVIYAANHAQEDGKDIFAISIGNGTPRKFSTMPTDVNAKIEAMEITAGDARLIYQANQDDLEVFELFSAEIPDVNDSPVISPTESLKKFVGWPIAVTIMADDPNLLDTLTVSSIQIPDWLTLTDNGDRTATLDGTPTTADIGVHTIELQVIDNEGGEATTTFEIEVLEIVSQLYLPVISAR